VIVTLESTTKIVKLVTAAGAVDARIWEGHTASGIAVHAFITRIAAEQDVDPTEFQRELQHMRAPSVKAEWYPLRMVL